MGKKIIHFMYVPFVGLGLYNGFRGNRWFRNRIQIFKQFVVPSLLEQTNRNFVVWISFTYEVRKHPYITELKKYLDSVGLWSVFTYSGVCFYDDKYPIDAARTRLVESVHRSAGELLDTIGDVDEVYMTIQPSDDCYCKEAVEIIQQKLDSDMQAIGFRHGYTCNYPTMDVCEYNPMTNPPFYTIKFTKEVFIDPILHVNYTSLKQDVGKYPAGTPLPSHEYVGDCVRYLVLDKRGFLVGTHGENISTHVNHPFKGDPVDKGVLKDFGLQNISPLKIKISVRKKILKLLPFKAQKRIRYIIGERLWNQLYAFLRN